MTDPPTLFAQNRATLTALTAAVRHALDTDPDAGRSQDDRLRAWCAATTHFLDPGYWSAALDQHTATQRAQAADAARQRAAVEAHEAETAAAAARRDATERAAHLNVTHPKPKL